MLITIPKNEFMKKAFSWIESKCIQNMLKQPKNTTGIRIVQGKQKQC